ncbi:MAG: hypothetical protein JO057_24110 [Chloroflexi bacterium]|nr:hypothetical protein [Chloroflexota bacterium]
MTTVAIPRYQELQPVAEQPHFFSEKRRGLGTPIWPAEEPSPTRPSPTSSGRVALTLLAVAFSRR